MRRTGWYGTGTALLVIVGALYVGDAAEAGVSRGQEPALPASGAQANERLAASPRRAEWAVIRAGADSVRAWVVYPARPQNAPVVVAVHDNQGMSNWIRAVADQLAAHGFIAIAPDLLTMLDVPRHPGGESVREGVSAAIGRVDQATRDRFIQAVGEWGTQLPGASSKYGIVGFCWGGSTVFAHAVAAPASLGAVVVYYGGSPAPDRLASVRAPILGLYARDDARVNTTVAPADSALREMGRTFEAHFFDGAGHGFTRSQEGRDGANLEAVRRAWPMTVTWFRTHLGA
ncbi:MAG TPA: dienelactone hydrolase family protein [Longimicrobiales bacterium]|nr:dienelactone hydrolase family protein [Longimicrobiales bacterium]